MSPRLGALLVVAGLALGGCSTAPVVDGEPKEPVYSAERLLMSDASSPFIVKDPFQGVNRAIYRFNAHLDRGVLVPVTRGYTRVVPQPARTGVRNFFNNLFGIRTFYNQILQARPVRAMQTTGRVIVNTTIGLVGLIDVATPMGIPYHKEDFGQTLGVWGLGAGPYIVLPLFGPSNLRDTTGLVVDSAIQSWLDPLNLDNNQEWAYLYYALLLLDTRERVGFQYHQTGSPFEYELVRTLSLTVREIEIKK